MNTKKCNKCSIDKPIVDFHKHPTGLLGRQGRCKDCQISANIKYKRTKEGVALTMFNSMIQSSKRRNDAPPLFTKEELKHFLLKQKKFNNLFDEWVASGYDKAQKPSCDRTDDLSGYSLDRLDLVTWRENKLKGEQDRKNGINNKVNKAVICIISNDFEIEYFSQSHASRELGIPQANISKCCAGERKTAGGFEWKHAS